MRDKMNDPARLALMADAIGNIEEFLSSVDSYELFVQNKVLCHAIIYNLQCIGESVYKLSREYVAAHPQMDWAAIEGLRHVLVHDYYQVNMETVWGIIQQDIPVLKTFLESDL
jgi:uncharacterized protein with HEPN domain